MYFDRDEEYGPMATMADAHAEWHRNAGVPMGQPGCPQDACDDGGGEYAEENARLDEMAAGWPALREGEEPVYFYGERPPWAAVGPEPKWWPGADDEPPF